MSAAVKKKGASSSLSSSQGARARPAKVKKQTLQLIPSSSALKQRLRGLGANPFVQITFKPSKPLSFIIDYVLRRRYGAHISLENQKSAAITFAFEGRQWSREDRQTEMKDVFAALKHPFRLTYQFDENILIDNGNAGPREPAADVFVAATRNATTLFDASNSLFGGGGGGPDASLGLGVFGAGDGSLHAFLGSIVMPPPQSVGPMASQFENENSFSTFLGSPAEAGAALSKVDEPKESKRSLFD